MVDLNKNFNSKKKSYFRRKQGCEVRGKQEFDIEFHNITITSQEHYQQDLHLVKSIHDKIVDYKELTQCHNLVPFDSEAPQPIPRT